MYILNKESNNPYKIINLKDNSVNIEKTFLKKNNYKHYPTKE